MDLGAFDIVASLGAADPETMTEDIQLLGERNGLAAIVHTRSAANGDRVGLGHSILP
jgi:hypothetical protein